MPDEKRGRPTTRESLIVGTVKKPRDAAILGPIPADVDLGWAVFLSECDGVSEVSVLPYAGLKSLPSIGRSRITVTRVMSNGGLGEYTYHLSLPPIMYLSRFMTPCPRTLGRLSSLTYRPATATAREGAILSPTFDLARTSGAPSPSVRVAVCQEYVSSCECRVQVVSIHPSFQ